MSFKFITCFLLLLGFYPAFSQKTDDEILKEKLQGKQRLNDILKTVNDHYKVPEVNLNSTSNMGLSKMVSPEVYRKLKKWARFEYENAPLVNEKGVIPDYPRHLQKALTKYQQSHGVSLMASTGNWSFIGPKTLSYGHGRQIGLGRIDRIVFHPNNANTYYVGAPSGGLWRTTDGGSNYACLTNYLPNPSVSGIVVDWSNTNTLYILTGDGNSRDDALVDASGNRRNSIGVWKSTDGGSTWNETGVLTTNPFRGYKLIQDPTNSQVLLAATTEGIFRTTNGGGTWTQVRIGTSWDIAFQPGNSNRIYAVIKEFGSTRFLTSTNNGASFSQVATFDFSIAGANRISIGVTPANTSRVYLVCGPGNPDGNSFFGFYKSTNSGLNFTRTSTSPNVYGNEDGGGLDQSEYDNCIGVSPVDADLIYVGGLVVYRSTNGGNSFGNMTRYDDGIASERDDYIHCDVHNLSINPLDNKLYATTDGGVYLSTNNGNNWSRKFNNLPTTQIYHMDVYEPSPQNILIGSQDNGIHKRFGNSAAFEQTQEGDGFQVQYKNDEADDFYVVINTKVKRLMSNGLTELDKYEFGGMFPAMAIHQTDNSRFYAARERFVSYEVNVFTDDWGTRAIPASWALITCPSNTNRIYGAGDSTFGPSNSGAMWRSDNSGDTWTNISNNDSFPAPGSYAKVTHIAVNPTNSSQVWVTLGGTNVGPKVMYSGNAGGSWKNITGSLPNNLPVNCVAVDASNNAYVGNDFGVFYRGNGWADWKPFFNGLPMVPVSDLHISESINQLRAATFGRGVWTSDLYNDCATNLNVTGAQEGQLFYEAGTTLNTNAQTNNGNVSRVFYRGGNYVQGTTGFEVAKGSEMRAWTGPCSSGIPTLSVNADGKGDFAAFQLAEMPISSTKKFPFAFIKNWKWDSKSECSFTLSQVSPGKIQVILVNESGLKLQEIVSSKDAIPGLDEKLRFTVSQEQIKETKRLLVFHDGKMVHWQELN